MRRELLVRVVCAALLMTFSFAFMGCDANSVTEINDNNETNNDEVLPTELQGTFPDGTYRGGFHDVGTYLGDQIGMQQVGIEFHLEDNQLHDLSFRVLARGGDNFMVPDDPNNEWPEGDLVILKEQYEQLLEYLEGKDVSEIVDLYTPEIAADDVEGTGEVVDTWTAATMRGNKVVHAIRDALNKGVYVPDDQ